VYLMQAPHQEPGAVPDRGMLLWRGRLLVHD
jgi:hypothetical protein